MPTRLVRAGRRAVPLTLLTLALAGCGAPSSRPSLLDSVKPYRADVVQGNFVSKPMAAQLHPGMTKDEVRNLLGTPLLQDMFHSDRWEYVFSLRQGYQTPLVRRFTVLFGKDGRLVSTDGDPLPSEDAFVAQINAMRTRSKPKTLTQTQLQAEIDAAAAKRTVAPTQAASAPSALTRLAPEATIHQLEADVPAQP